MATNTHVALDKVTVGTATPSITFTGISGAYTDLFLVMDLGAATAGQDIYCQVNGDTGSNYSHTRLTGDGTSATSSRNSSLAYMRLSDGGSPQTTANSITQISFMNYSNTTTYKTALNRASNGNRGTDAVVNLWRSTAAITSITVYLSSGDITVGSTFSLYGILAEGVSPAPKATGGAIYSDSTYYYHAFGTTGTFTPTQSITADVLVVAGGGGGGRSGGGGGAGGLLAFSSQSLTATGYTCTVGSGGAGNNTDTQTGTVGGDSQFGALTLVKGGGGGGSYNANGATGGSGGGGGSYEGATKTGGAATSGQGSAGGNGFNGTTSGNRAGGGGGGAGAVGGAAASAYAGNGGIGSSTYSSWGVVTGVGENVSGTYYLAGGGGGYAPDPLGGLSGSGGGGARGVAGKASTGGGGGGSASDGTTGFNGGSGVVVVRYAKV
jgi:hypothetical protein